MDVRNKIQQTEANHKRKNTTYKHTHTHNCMTDVQIDRAKEYIARVHEILTKQETFCSVWSLMVFVRFGVLM